MSDPLPDEVCAAAADLILKPLGSQLRHYMPGLRAAAIEITRAVLQSVRDHDADSIRDAVDALTKRAKEGA